MRTFVLAVLKRLAVSVIVIGLIGAFGLLYGHFVGPSRIAYAGSVVLIAWPWSLPQVFVVVSIIWFFVGGLRRGRRNGSNNALTLR
jgi:hypothetical protein